MRDLLLLSPVLLHPPDLQGATAVAAEGDLLPVGRVGGAGCEAWGIRELAKVVPVWQDGVDVDVAVGAQKAEGEPAIARAWVGRVGRLAPARKPDQGSHDGQERHEAQF